MFRIEEEALTGAATLPLSREELNSEGDAPILIHMKVGTSNRSLVLGVEQAVREALRGLRVHGYQMVAIVTPEGVEMEIADIKRIAQFVTPLVRNDLGIPQFKR